MNKYTTSRIDWIDILRGYGMIFVVIGHVLLGMLTAGIVSSNGWARACVLFVYLFQMPLIFFVSGFVSKDKYKSFSSFLFVMGKWVVFPYFFWSTLLILIQNAAPGHVNNQIPMTAILTLLWKPISIYWFLYVFFIIKLIGYLSGMVCSKSFRIAVLWSCAGLLFWVLLQFMGGAGGLLSKTLGGLFFYYVGRMCSERLEVFNRIVGFFDSNVFLMASACVACIVLLFGITAYYYVEVHGAVNFISNPQKLYPITGIIGVVLFVIASRQFSYLNLAVGLRAIGVYSMIIYLQHTIWGAWLRSLLVRSNIESPFIMVAIISVGSIVLPIVCQRIMDRYRLSWLIGVRAAS